MLSDQRVKANECFATSHVGSKNRWRMRTSIVVLMLACSLVAVDAFGQPLSDVSEHQATPESAPQGVARCSAPAHAAPTWCEKVERWVDAQRAYHGFYRAMALPEDISIAHQDKRQVAEYIDRFFDKSTREMLGNQEKILRALDVLPTQKSYAQILRELLIREVSGYYEPEDQMLYLVAERIEDLDAGVVIHELQHLAQDRAWDLSALLRPNWYQSDLLSARSALVEGDAMFTYFSSMNRGNPSYLLRKGVDAMRKGVDAINLSLFDRYPRFVLEQLTMPYVEGLEFARVIYAYDGWHGLNDVYDIPPMSTAEILYPERYRKKIHPTLLHYDLSPEESGTRRYTDVWGMMTMRHLFHAMIAPDRLLRDAERQEIEDVTRGWIGDRVELWERRKGKERRMVWLIALSDEDEAHQLFEWMTGAFTPLLATEWTCAAGTHGSHCGRVDGRTGMLLEHWGDMVLWVRLEHRDASAIESELLAIAEDVFRTLRRTAYPNIWRYHTLAHVPAVDPAALSPEP